MSSKNGPDISISIRTDTALMASENGLDKSAKAPKRKHEGSILCLCQCSFSLDANSYAFAYDSYAVFM